MLEYQIVLRLVKHFLLKFVVLFRKYVNMCFFFLVSNSKCAILGSVGYKNRSCFFLHLTNLIKKCVHMPKKFALLCWIIYYGDIFWIFGICSFAFFFDPLKKKIAVVYISYKLIFVKRNYFFHTCNSSFHIFLILTQDILIRQRDSM